MDIVDYIVIKESEMFKIGQIIYAKKPHFYFIELDSESNEHQLHLHKNVVKMMYDNKSIDKVKDENTK